MGRILPILFNTEMVRAVLDGSKTATRRAMKPQPLFYTGRKYIFADDECPKKWVGCDDIVETYQYQKEDILYVREAWAEWTDGYVYRAGTPPFAQAGESAVMTWHPSIHMPKGAARIWLKVTDVRVEQLQDITDDDCMREGIRAWTKDGRMYKYYPADQEGDYPDCEWSECPGSPKEAMKRVWDSTIRKPDLDRYGWKANPWVWVIEFERCDKPEEV